MKPILVGSRAVKFWFTDFKCRENSDWDFIGEPQDIPVEGRIEWHDPKFLNNSHVEAWEWPNLPYNVVSIRYLAAMYRSHLHRPEKFDHNICVYHKFLGHVHSSVRDFYETRKQMTYAEFGNRHPKLSQSNEDFFDDNVEKEFDHDYIHELYAYEDRPMFERLKYQGQEDKAWCAKDLWDLLSWEQKVQCVAEETYVIATERFLVPTRFQDNYRYSYYRALRKVCTTLTSGWFRDFALDNFPSIWQMYDPNRISQTKEKLT